MIKFVNLLIFLSFLIFTPSNASGAFLPHDYPAIHIHMMGRFFFFIAMVVVIVFILKYNMHKDKQWKYFLISIISFLLWNLMVFFGRFGEIQIIGEGVGWQYFDRMVVVEKTTLIYYFLRFDFLVLNMGAFYLYLSLKSHLKKYNDTCQQTLMPVIFLPFFPIALVQIFGGTIFIILTVLCLIHSINLYRKEKENILWNYMLWLTASLLVYAISRGFAYILQHYFVASGHKDIWEIIAPISGSINTIFFFWVGFISLFFIMIYKAYLKIQEEESKLQRVNLDLIQLNRELETLVAERTMALMGLTVADRVRNPAVLIGALCKRIVKKEEKLNQDILDIIDECKKLETIVGEFETLLKTRQSVFEYADLNEIINSIFYAIDQEVLDKQIQFILNLSEEPMRINLQRNLLKAAIFHVIRNAIEATPPGGKIIISTSREGDNIVLSITDTGRGIHKENLERIFDPFFSTKELRFGMGLPLVRQIVAEHLGDLKIDSELGKGTTVKMIFPVRWKPKK